MDFIGFLRDMIGRGQKPAAPPEQVPASIRRPAEPINLPAAPARQSAWAPVSLPTPERSKWAAPPAAPEGPRTENWAGRGSFMTSPLNKPPALPENTFPNGQVNYMSSPNPGAANQVVEKEQTEQAEAGQKNWFGGEDKYATEQMSVEEYLNLSPRQRAAVDANTALVQAVEQDNAASSKQPGTWDQSYLDQVKETFGETGGSDTYAPRTMGVLTDLGLDLQGKDLDQYLNYSALVTADDLGSLAPGTTAAQDNPRQQNATAFSEAASVRLSQTLAAGQTLLDGLRTGSDKGRELFGAPTTPALTGELEAELAQAFDIFSQARSQPDLTPEKVSAVYTELQEKHGVTPNEVAQYFETRLQANEYLNVTADQPTPLGEPDSKLEYLAPKDFRSKFLMRGE